MSDKSVHYEVRILPESKGALHSGIGRRFVSWAVREGEDADDNDSEVQMALTRRLHDRGLRVTFEGAGCHFVVFDRDGDWKGWGCYQLLGQAQAEDEEDRD